MITISTLVQDCVSRSKVGETRICWHKR